VIAQIVASFPKIREPIAQLLEEIDVRKARTDKPEDMFKDQGKFPDIAKARAVSAECISSL
jgi:hypothetical protein